MANMLQNPRKTLGFKKNMVYKIPPGGGGKPYPASGLKMENNQTEHSNVLLIISRKWRILRIIDNSCNC